MSDTKPMEPSCEGFQYAKNPYDAHNYLDPHFDENNNEIVSDRPMHENSTPAAGSFNFGAGHYSHDFIGGYGVSVGTPSPSRESADVNSQSTERGKES